jgi:hypothetical protein
MDILIGTCDVSAAEPDAELILLDLNARVAEHLAVPGLGAGDRGEARFALPVDTIG